MSPTMVQGVRLLCRNVVFCACCKVAVRIDLGDFESTDESEEGSLQQLSHVEEDEFGGEDVVVFLWGAELPAWGEFKLKGMKGKEVPTASGSKGGNENCCQGDARKRAGAAFLLCFHHPAPCTSDLG